MNALSFSHAGLMLPFLKTRRWVAMSHIVRLEGVGNYTTCYFVDGSQLLTALSLKVLADRLPEGAFLRTHRKHLVNRAFIAAIQRHDATVQLANGDRITIARRRAEPLFRAFSLNS